MELITSKKTENTLNICFNGRIDSANAAQAEADIFKIIGENLGVNYIIDAENLEYISSAGLRVILRMRKENPELKIINASTEVYEILDMTGFSEMIPVEKAYRHLSVDGCDIIGKGAKGAVYRYNADTIIKVYFDSDSLPAIQRERELARKAFVLGIPTAISYDVVKVGDKFGSVFELLDAKSYSQMILEDSDNFSKYVKEFANLLRTIHSTQVKADDMPDVKILVNKWLDATSKVLEPDVQAKIEKLVANTPDTLNMLHSDYHTNNIMMQNGETLLIDMDTLSHGHPIFELANVYITYVGFGEVDPTNVENFIGFSYENAKRFWREFIPVYLDTTDEERIKEVEKKARLLSCVRNIRHISRREGIDNPGVTYFKNELSKIVDEVDSLDF